MIQQQTRRSRGRRAAALCALAGLLLAACAVTPALPGSEPPTPDPGVPGTPVDPTPPAALGYEPEGSAEQNLAAFDAVLREAAAQASGRPTGKRLVDALRAAGFPKARMEVTRDRTRTDLRADATSIAVRHGEECLIAQFLGRERYTSIIAPALESSGCLVGETRPIDW